MRLSVTEKEKYFQDPYKCPYCGSEVSSDEAPDVEINVASQRVHCLNENCGKSWTDIYKLSDIEEDD